MYTYIYSSDAIHRLVTYTPDFISQNIIYSTLRNKLGTSLTSNIRQGLQLGITPLIDAIYSSIYAFRTAANRVFKYS